MATAPRPSPTPPTTVLLVRHGQTATTGSVLPGRASGLHLSSAGEAQAHSAAQRLTTIAPVAAIYVSPMERTKETAAPIGRALGIRPKVERGLIECDFGDWTGRKLATLTKLAEWRTVQSTPSVFRFPGGESFVEMQVRMVQTIERLAARHPGARVVVVSHADPIKAYLAHAAGTHLDHFQRLVVSPCSISSVLLSDGHPVVLTVNSTGDDLSTLRPS